MVFDPNAPVQWVQWVLQFDATHLNPLTSTPDDAAPENDFPERVGCGASSIPADHPMDMDMPDAPRCGASHLRPAVLGDTTSDILGSDTSTSESSSLAVRAEPTNAERDDDNRRRRVCPECGEKFKNLWDLEIHGGKTGHGVHRCRHEDCGASFTRPGDLRRHQSSKHDEDVATYRCDYCKKPGFEKMFKRKDHLRQHLRNYHHIDTEQSSARGWLTDSCPHSHCPEYRVERWGFKGEDRPFESQSDWRKHMKTVHDESPFPCPESECNKVRGNGYFRKLDLVRHLKKEHQRTTGFENITSSFRG